MKHGTVFLFLILLLTVAPYLLAHSTLQEEQDFRFAIELENKELFDIAALQFERFAELYPSSPQAPVALLRAGENYEKADSLIRASNVYLAVLLKFSQSSIVDRAQFNQARLLANNNEHLKAGIAYDRLKILAPNSPLVPEAQLAAARSYLSAGESRKSLDAALYLLENFATHPTRMDAYKAIADVHEVNGDYGNAILYLDRILGDRVEDDLAADVYVKKSQLLKKLGRFSESDSVLFKLVSGKYASPIVVRAANELAVSMLDNRQYQEAEKILTRVIEKVGQADKIDLWQSLGDTYYLQGNYALAKQTYMKATNDPGKTGLFVYRLGMVNKKLGEVSVALTHFEQVLADTNLTSDVRFYAAIEYANLLSADGRAVQGIRYLQNYIASTPALYRRNELFFAIANLQENILNDYAGARQNYNAIIAGSPKSAIVDDAQFSIARSYEVESELQNALREYDRYLQYYPGGDFYATAQKKAYLLKLMTPSDSRNLDEALNQILVQGLTAESRAHAFNSLAQYHLHSFRNYEKALDLLQRAEKEDVDERLNKEQLQYDKAFCLFVLHEKSMQENRLNSAQNYAQNLQQLAEQMKVNYPNSKLTAQVEFWVVQTNLPNLESGARRIGFLNSHIETISDDSLKQHLQIQLVDEMMAARTDTSAGFQRIGQILADILNHHKTEKIEADALYKQALLLHQTSRPDSATVLLNRLLTRHDSPRRVDGLYLLATIHEENRRYIDAQRLYFEIAEKYFYSPWASRAEAKLISLMLRQGQYKEAQQRVRAKEQTGIPRELKHFYPAQVDDETLWLWAEVIRFTQSPQKAVEMYQKYLDLGSDTRHRADALFAVGELADKMNKQEMALGYFEECAASFPDDSLGQQALVKAADLSFDRGLYDQARVYYEKIRVALTGDLQKRAFQRLIICDFRLGKINRAEGLVKTFKKEYDDRNAEARFLYEEAMHYIDAKNLSQAEKTLKTLAGRYDDVPEGARGDLGLARLYVVQTKTEDALKRLTEIPEKYEDPEIVATAYLNLADFYYENRALENTIHAGRKVLELQESGPLRAQALDLLIDAYDDLGLRDQAIAYQREYIETFPYASNILDRRIRIGTFLYYLKEYDRAIVELKDVKPLVSADDEARVQFWIAESYAGAGFTEQAIIEYLKVRYQCKQHPKLPFGVTAVYKAGENYQKLGNLLKAKEMYEIVIRERGATDDFGRAANRKLEEIKAELEKDS
ncbi:tetratricopeptide repeat protein [candidate division KSB1 bacterium]|nr:tetratricopeptide repeat protein [candidate division KSB1 bacterium]